MSKLTKKMIIEQTVALAGKKPLSKITIRDITDACGITRNTFYYYYHDIFDVIDDLVTEKVAELSRKSPEEPEEAMFEFIEFCLLNRKVLLNLYRTIGHDAMSGYAMRQLRGVISDSVRAQAGDPPLNEEDLSMICAFYEEAFFGLMVRWLNDPYPKNMTSAEIRRSLRRIRRLFDGQFALLIANARSVDGIANVSRTADAAKAGDGDNVGSK